MCFDFDLFSVLAAKAYRRITNTFAADNRYYVWRTYSLDAILRVFEYYFITYENKFDRPYPPIRMEQIERIIHVMPYWDPINNGGYCADVDPENYEPIIDKHFKTRYRNCDYNINHFFSGNIRLLRMYEELY